MKELTNANNRLHLYMAPLEGITGYIYRNAIHDIFGGIDQYYAPFIDGRINRPLKAKELRDVLPENNQGIRLIPQIMANNPEAFLATALQMNELGYEEVNLNLGCPSPTVVRKGKGAGFLEDPDVLKRFFQKVYEHPSFAAGKIKLSVKTRLGMSSADEIHDLMQVYNQFPIFEIILHPRIQSDYYKNTPDMEAFQFAIKECNCPLVYNGDINSVTDAEKLFETVPDISGIMLGRGMLRNPGFARQLQSMLCHKARTSSETNESSQLSKDDLKQFHDRIYHDYQDYLSGDMPVLHKMKELWVYMIDNFTEDKKLVKALKKSQTLREYEANVNLLFQNDWLGKV